MRCPNCNAENPAPTQRCQQCDASLVAVRLRQILEQAQADIKRGEYEIARTQLTAVEAELAITDVGVDETMLIVRCRWLDALILYYQGMLDQALDKLLPLLAILESEAGDKQMFGEILNTLGNIEYVNGNGGPATRYYQRGLRHVGQVGGELAARLWANLGNISTSEGRMHEALFRYNKAAQFAETHGDPTTLMLSYRLLCHVYIHIGPISRGIQYAQRVVELLPQVENQNFVSQALVSVAGVHRCSGDFDLAVEYLSRALSIAHAGNNKIVEAYALARLSWVRQDMGDFAGSYEPAIEVFNEPATPIILKKEAAARLVEYHTSMGEFARARKYIDWLHRFDQQLGREDHERFYRAIAHFYAAQRNWRQAEANFQLAIAQSKHRGDAYDLGRDYHEYARAIAQREGAITPAAQEMLTQAATIFRKIGASHNLALVDKMLKGEELPPHQQPQQFHCLFLGAMRLQHVFAQVRQQLVNLCLAGLIIPLKPSAYFPQPVGDMVHLIKRSSALHLIQRGAFRNQPPRLAQQDNLIGQCRLRQHPPCCGTLTVQFGDIAQARLGGNYCRLIQEVGVHCAKCASASAAHLPKVIDRAECIEQQGAAGEQLRPCLLALAADQIIGPIP